jgi:L-histidine Nalpha-methyltransferase
VSANLAPGADYAAGVERILSLYDNEMTRDWLMTFLLDLGVEKTDGALRFRVEELSEPCRLKRITAEFHFSRARNLQLESEQFGFQPGESIRLFFSYRHTPTLIRTLLGGYGLEVIEQWITASGEEGVFLVETMKP